MLSIEEKKEKEKRSVKESFVVSILLIVFAFVLLFKAEDIISTLVLIVGFVGLVFGSFHIIRYFRLEEAIKPYSNDIFSGMIMILFGGVAILKNDMMANMLTYFIGGYVLYKNAYRFQLCLNFSKKDSNFWKYLMGLSVGNIFLGILILLNPFEGKIAIPTVIAVCVIASEFIYIIQNICLLVGLRKNHEDKN